MVYGQDYYGFIYKWVNTLNGKYYIGSHFGSIDDGYIGSGVHFRRAFNKNSSTFQREILEYLKENDINVLLQIEQQYLIEVCEIENKNKCYNISKIAGGGYQLEGKTSEEILEIYSKISKTLKNKTPEEREEINKKTRLTLESNPKKYKDAIEKGKQTKKNWSAEKRAEVNLKMKNTVDSNPEKKQAAIEKRKQNILNMTPEEHFEYTKPWRKPWSEKRKQDYKEQMKLKRESRTPEQIDIERKNRSEAQKTKKRKEK